MGAQVIETEMSDPVRARALSHRAGPRAFAVPVALLLIGAVMLAFCWWARDLHRFTQWVSAYIWLFIGELAMCMLACGVVMKWGRHSSRVARLLTLGIILFFAIGLRLTLVPQRPFLSTDAYRYVWDGHVQAHGINPYRYAPDDPQLAPLRDPDQDPDAARIYVNVNWHDLPTPYPPVAQLIYLLVNWLHPLRVTTFKAAAMVFDTITVLALMWTLARSRMDPARAILFAWHPLPIWEGAHSGHIEAAFMMLLTLALLAWTRRRHWLTGILLGLATGVKYYPALVLPAFLRTGETDDPLFSRLTDEPAAMPWRARLMSAVRAVMVNRANLEMLAAFALTLVIVYLPYVWTGATGFGALNNEFREEGFTGTGVRYFALDVIHRVVRLPASLFLLVAAAMLVALGVWWATRTKTGVSVVARGAVTLVGMYCLLTSPRYAWYYAWILPFLCFTPRLGWIYLTGASIFMYCLWYEPLVYPELPFWLGAVVYLPALGWLAWEKWREHVAQANHLRED